MRVSTRIFNPPGIWRGNAALVFLLYQKGRDDYTVKSGPQRVRDLMGEEAEDATSIREFGFTNPVLDPILNQGQRLARGQLVGAGVAQSPVKISHNYCTVHRVHLSARRLGWGALEGRDGLGAHHLAALSMAAFELAESVTLAQLIAAPNATRSVASTISPAHALDRLPR